MRHSNHARKPARILLLMAVLALGLALSACGNKGPLRQPDANTAPAGAAA
jgi:predicted small lipoprotein YifL